RARKSLMNENRGTISMSRGRPVAAIFWGGLLAGVFDITQAFVDLVLLGVRPFRILQHIAGGILGKHSFEMGWTSAMLGLLLHFTIAFTAATVYFLASARFACSSTMPLSADSLMANLYFSLCISQFCLFRQWGQLTSMLRPMLLARWAT